MHLFYSSINSLSKHYVHHQKTDTVFQTCNDACVIPMHASNNDKAKIVYMKKGISYPTPDINTSQDLPWGQCDFLKLFRIFLDFELHSALSGARELGGHPRYQKDHLDTHWALVGHLEPDSSSEYSS